MEQRFLLGEHIGKVMVNQPKQINVSSVSDRGVNATETARFGPGTGQILRQLMNYHNIWWGFTCEPVDASANAQGNWILWVKKNTNNADTSFTDTEINSGDSNMEIIACGVWGASNETPFTFSSQLKSSRNLVANQELVLSVLPTGITAGLVSIKCILCASITTK